MYAKYAKLTKIDNKPKIFKICTQKNIKKYTKLSKRAIYAKYDNLGI